MLELKDHGPVRELRLARPPANALNGPLVAALTEALENAAAESEAVVVSAAGRMFCAGLDVPEWLQMDRPEFTRAWRAFIGLMKTIADMPVPVVFAMQGHAVGGGLLLSLFGDYRIMPRGPYKTGLNEVRVGLIAPSPVHRALVRLTGPRPAERMLVGGDLLGVDEALEIGCLDELAESPEGALPAALAWCEKHLALPRNAMTLSRDMARADLRAVFDNYSERDNESYADLWFSEATQATLTELVSSLRK